MSEISRQALTKAEFSEMIHEVGVPVGEGENFLDDEQKYPKIAYWEYVWRDLTASGSSYDTVVRYQISYASTRGRDAGLKRLKRALNSRVSSLVLCCGCAGRSSGGVRWLRVSMDSKNSAT